MMMTPIMREFEKEDCLLLRPLWEEVFYEDSKEFTDYYFKEKAVRNHAFALQKNREGTEDAGDGGSYISMLYLAPYDMMLRTGSIFLCREINYIIGVATKREYRHRGYMERLLKAALSYMYEKGQPFTFLMPASPKIYEPYQFTYIYDRENFEIKEMELSPADSGQFTGLAEYASRWLAENKDVFIARNEEYYRVMAEELRAQQGAIYLLHKEKKINGYVLYTEEDGKGNILESVMGEKTESCPIISGGRKSPAIMARAVNLQVLLGLLRAEEDNVVLTIEVTDPILVQNSGKWKCHVKKDIASVEKQPSENASDCIADMEGITAWMFGYSKVEDCFRFSGDIAEEKKKSVLFKLYKIKTLKKIFINEIV